MISLKFEAFIKVNIKRIELSFQLNLTQETFQNGANMSFGINWTKVKRALKGGTVTELNPLVIQKL
ncbi:hypothetical protein BpHYR1_005151, partial [Brachionus plicatilis]